MICAVSAVGIVAPTCQSSDPQPWRRNEKVQGTNMSYHTTTHYHTHTQHATYTTTTTTHDSILCKSHRKVNTMGPAEASSSCNTGLCSNRHARRRDVDTKCRCTHARLEALYYLHCQAQGSLRVRACKESKHTKKLVCTKSTQKEREREQVQQRETKIP